MIQITITVDDTGNCNVNGPLANKILCYGVLEMAKEAIRNFKGSDSGIIPVAGPMLVPKNRQ